MTTVIFLIGLCAGLLFCLAIDNLVDRKKKEKVNE